MREIKFRVWRKDLKEMIYPTIDKEGGEQLVLLFYNNWKWQVKMEDMGWAMATSRSDSILMQFIGEKDKNNKEIYEGDKIRNPYEYAEDDLARGSYEQVYEVKFISGMFTLQEEDDGDFVTSLPDWKNLEVIGNIYENPELVREA